MLTLDCFKAGKGDSFLLRWGETLEHNMLIDSGVDGTYRFIATALKKVEELESILVTHIDYDHIGGFFKLLQDKDYSLSNKLNVYLNTPSMLLYNEKSSLVKLEHGVNFEMELEKKNIVPIPIYKGLFPKNKFLANGINIQILTPGKNVIDKLIEQWTALEIYQEYIKEKRKSEDKVSSSSKELRTSEKIIRYPPRAKKWDKDLINSSSISFIACDETSSILFLGDANPTLVCDELEELDYKDNSKLKLDLVKISHHGSKHNTTKELLKRIECKNFYISTDSSGPYYHPNRETIILISTYSRESTDTPLNIFSNYKLNVDRLLTKSEQSNLNINFEEINHFNFPI